MNESRTDHKANVEIHTIHIGLISCGVCPPVKVHADSTMATTAIDWLVSPAVHSAGLVMWDIGFFTCYPGHFIACISCGFSGTRPSCTLSFHFVLDDFEVQERESGKDDCDKTLKASKMVLVLWKPGVVKLSMRLDSINKSSLYPTCHKTSNSCDPKLLMNCYKSINFIFFRFFFSSGVVNCAMLFIKHPIGSGN